MFVSFSPKQFLRKYYSFCMFCDLCGNIWFDILITVFLSFLSLAQADVMLRRISVSASIPDSLIEIKMINERPVKTWTNLIILKILSQSNIVSSFEIIMMF